MKRFIYRGEELLGTHSLHEAAAMLAEGSLLPDDWVSEGLGFIPLATWLEQ